jgi:ribose transport system substrate-binding protein
VRGDDVDFTKARTNVDDVLVANPEINCMVGFYSYNPPRIYEALQATPASSAPGHRGGLRRGPGDARCGRRARSPAPSSSSPSSGATQGMKLMAEYLERRQVGHPRGQADHRADRVI